MVTPDQKGLPIAVGSGGLAKAAPGVNSAVPITPASDCARRLKSLVRRFTLDVCLLQGQVDGGPLRVIVADDGSVLPYLGSVFFSESFSVRGSGQVLSVNAPRLAKSDADLVVVGANQYLLPLYPAKRFHFIPKWVRIYLPISADPDTMVGDLSPSVRNDIRRNLRRMKEKGFTYEVTRDPAWFDKFYHEMYVPFANVRHGNLARVHSYEHLKAYYDRGFGLIVTREGRHIAATIAYSYGPTLCNSYMGVADGDQEIAREGASTALYYYTMVYAHSIGCTGVDFGNSRPFLSDGALRFKLKWGMQVLDIDDGVGVYAIAANTDRGRDFLSRNRFFHLHGKRIVLSENHTQEDKQ